MEISLNYSNHKNIVKDLSLYQDNGKEQAQYKERFELIYKDAKNYDLKLSNAKSFLETLSVSDMDTLKNFSGLHYKINIDDLSDEGAYNLLMHSYERYDFNNNGFTEIGATHAVLPVPRNMEADAKEAWVKTINKLDENDIVALYNLTLAIDTDRIEHSLAINISEMSEQKKEKLQENTSFDIDIFQKETLSKVYHPKQISVDDITNEVNNILDNRYTDTLSPEILEATNNFWNIFKIEYENIKKEKGEKIPTIELFEKKEQLSKQENKNRLGSLEQILQTVITEISSNSSDRYSLINDNRTPEEIIKEYRSLPGGDGIYVEGIFEQMQIDAALLLKKHEPSFKRDYPLYEKYKDIFTPVYSNYTREKANNLGRDLYEQFSNIKAMKDKAYLGGSQEDKDAFWDMYRDYMAYNKYLRKKYDIDMSFKYPYTQEASKAYNFTVYEQLENGVNLAEARQKASIVAGKFDDGEGFRFSSPLIAGIPENMDKEMIIMKGAIDYKKQIDLRDKGYKHDFSFMDYATNFGIDFKGIEARLLYEVELFSFLFENEKIVDKKLSELKSRASKDDEEIQSGSYAMKFKASIEKSLEDAKFAKKIFEKYADKIFAKDINDPLQKQIVEKAITTKNNIELTISTQSF